MKRILIKLSGEGLSNKKEDKLIDQSIVQDIARQVKEITQLGIQVGIVVGGGNFWRGANAKDIKRNRADYIGMLATVMNGLVLQSAMESQKLKAKTYSSLGVDERVANKYVNEKAINDMQNGDVLIFAGGTGRPYFTTDTASTLFASEIGADSILMGKNGVSGIFDSDPKLNPKAKKFDTITWNEILEKKLNIMDSTAASMARDNNIELIVFDITEKNALVKAINNNIECTKVSN